MRSFSVVTSFALLTALLTGCPSGKDVTETGVDDSGGTGTSVDADDDGFTADEDCDDNDASINPDADEECDGIDNDCDGDLDEGVTTTYYQDEDGDGFGTDATTEACTSSEGWVPVSGDCDDTDSLIYPDAEEICDGADNDCNGTIDDGLPGDTYYADSDSDGLGNPDEMTTACEQPEGYVANSDDCDDIDPLEPVFADVEAGSSTGAGTATNPLDTIQACIDQAEVCCYVNRGVYDEDIDFGGKDILVKGVDGAENTVINGTGEGSVVTFANGESADAILTGFTISGGAGTEEVTTSEGSGDTYEPGVTTTTYRYYGGGIYISTSSPTLYDLILSDNTLAAYSYSNPTSDSAVYVYSYGGGIFAASSDADIWSISLVDNYADDGGGAYVNSASSLTGKWLVFDGNWASAGGGVSAAGSLSLGNSIFVDNGSSSDSPNIGGAAINVEGGDVSLSQVTTASNEGMATAYVSSSGSLTMDSSILYDNDAGYMIDGEVGTTLSSTYSDIYGGYYGEVGSVYTSPIGSSGNISADPEFTSFTDNGSYDDDLTLGSGSPAVGTGSGGADMGAYGGADGSW